MCEVRLLQVILLAYWGEGWRNFKKMARGQTAGNPYYYAVKPFYDWYESEYDRRHGYDRYDWENMPFLGQIHWYNAQRQRAEDYYEQTGTDDRYGDAYTGRFDSFVNGFTGQVSRPARMARNVEDVFTTEVEEDMSPPDRYNGINPYTGKRLIRPYNR